MISSQIENIAQDMKKFRGSSNWTKHKKWDERPLLLIETKM